MAELKTRRTGASVGAFLRSVADEGRRRDAKTVSSMMRRITGERPEMWGPSIVGFGRIRYRYESGREGEWFLTGFSPRRTSLVLYVMSGFDRHAALMKKLGKHRTGKSCLYVNRLDDVDPAVVERLIAESVNVVKERHAGVC